MRMNELIVWKSNLNKFVDNLELGYTIRVRLNVAKISDMAFLILQIVSFQ